MECTRPAPPWLFCRMGDIGLGKKIRREQIMVRPKGVQGTMEADEVTGNQPGDPGESIDNSRAGRWSRAAPDDWSR